jgi:hypothetical protein
MKRRLAVNLRAVQLDAIEGESGQRRTELPRDSTGRSFTTNPPRMSNMVRLYSFLT